MNLAQTLYPDKDAELIYMSNHPSSPITIYKNKNYTWLLVSDVVQSAIENQLPHRPAVPYCFVMLLPLLHHKKPNSILELGAGALSIQRYLSYSHPSIKITSVENSKDIIESASRYFPPINDPLIIEGNAFDFINQAIEKQEKYDWILFDVFNGSESPITSKSGHLLKQLKQLISPNGWLIMNLLTQTEEEIELIGRNLQQVFKTKHYCFPVSGVLNKIIMANKINEFSFPIEIEQHNTAN